MDRVVKGCAAFLLVGEVVMRDDVAERDAFLHGPRVILPSDIWHGLANRPAGFLNLSDR